MGAHDQVPTGTGPGESPAGAQYEFNAEQNKVMAGVGWGFRILGLVFALASLKLVIRLVRGIVYLADGGGRPVTTTDVIEYACLLVLCLPVAVWMYQSSFAFESVVETQGRDIDHLMRGLAAIRRSFRWVIGFALAAVVVSLLVPLAIWARIF